MHSPRILFAAPASGSGKTTIACGILRTLKNRGKRISAFKCGPDYIDPMFHERVVGVKSGTLDLFFSDEAQLRRLYAQNAEEADCAVIEGVMGYYDGMSAASDEASTYAVAKALRAPVVLIIDARGQSLSALATLKGFLNYRSDSGIKGVLFNRMSEHVYKALKPEVEALGVVPIGFLPKSDDLMIESRHLGLETPNEISDLSEKLDALAALLEQTLDFDALEALMGEAEELKIPAEPDVPNMPKTVIAVAKDEAFCFLYRDNLALLRRYGAEVRFFSPLHDTALPKGTQGLILPGGYPELFAKQLSENKAMRDSIRTAIENGMPCLAECGGFLYLHDTLSDMDGDPYPMCGVIRADAYLTQKLSRFGYATLSAKENTAFFKAGETIKAHEFHYFESGDPGAAFSAVKPNGREWTCIHADGNLLAGFPHLFYESDPKPIERFLRGCAKED
ncbi:MAG: cobyrinate a,c-diamide synthase [Clostridia bacterium]|nr:cobyrinate a,c-diamide synthase [Clostridia bacterium]